MGDCGGGRCRSAGSGCLVPSPEHLGPRRRLCGALRWSWGDRPGARSSAGRRLFRDSLRAPGSCLSGGSPRRPALRRSAHVRANLHVVGSRYLPPTNAEAGRGYSLELNPSGLEFSIFVSHCWAADFGELVDPLLQASDPPASTCCSVATGKNMTMTTMDEPQCDCLEPYSPSDDHDHCSNISVCQRRTGSPAFDAACGSALHTADC